MDLHQLYNEHQLFQQIAQGDEQAFRYIFHEYNARLFPFAIRITKSEPDAEEIIQEVFLRLWIHRESLGEMEQPVAWLYKVTANLALSYLRKEAATARKLKRISVTGSGAEDNTVDNMAAKEIQLLISEAVDHLPPKRQLIYKLSREQGLSHKEIADKLAISQHTVKNQLVVAIKFIQEYIRKAHGWLLPIIILLFI